MISVDQQRLRGQRGGRKWGEKWAGTSGDMAGVAGEQALMGRPCGRCGGLRGNAGGLAGLRGDAGGCEGMGKAWGW